MAEKPASVAPKSGAPVRFSTSPFDDAAFRSLPPELAKLAAVAEELAERSLAPSTRHGYGLAFARWEAWCDSKGLSAMPPAPAAVAVWIVEIGATVDGDGNLVIDDHAAGEVHRLRPVSLGPVLAALNRAASVGGHPKPGDDPAVQAVLKGLRNTYGMHPHNQRLAIELDMLIEMHACLCTPTDEQLRDAVAIVLRGVGLSLAQCSARSDRGLHWTDIDVNLDDTVTVRLAGPSSGAEVALVLTGGDAEALRNWRARCSGVGAVLDLSRQAISDVVTRRVERCGLGADADLADSDVRRLVLRSTAEASNAQLRDRALLLIGWWSALRRSNLSLLRWKDIRIVEDGIELFLRRSKNDQEAHGAWVFIPRSTDPTIPCPVEALARYLDRLAADIGVGHLCDAPNEPVFVPVDRHDRFKRSSRSDGARLSVLSGAAINEAVQRWVENLGASSERYGAHSLRAGFITEAFASGATAAEIQLTSQHRSLEVLMGYNRPHDRRSRSAGARIQRHRDKHEKPPEPERRTPGPPAEFLP